MKDLIGIRFVLTGGAFINAILCESDAKGIMRGWKLGEFVIKGKTIIGSDDYQKPQKDDWAVRVEDIMAIHTFDWVQYQQAMQQNVQPSRGPFPYTSN